MLYLNFSKYYELSCNKLSCTMHFNAHTQTFLWAIHAELEVLVADVHTCAALVDTDKQFYKVTVPTTHSPNHNAGEF